MSQLPRLASLLCAALLSLASAASSPDPRMPPPPPPPPGGEPPAPGAGSPYFCHEEQSADSGASLCRPTYQACEDERNRAAEQGLTTTFCNQTTPVACFQLGGQPETSSEWCAASLADCEAWRRADKERNQRDSPACAFAH